MDKFDFGVNINCLDDSVILLKQMVTMKRLPSLVDFSKLFKTMINMKHYSAVLSLFSRNAEIGYCLMHRVDCAFSVLPIYLKNGIPFNVVTFNILLRGIFAENKVKDKICEPDEVVYATVMNGLSKRGHTEKTLSLLRLMEQGNTKPDIINYNIIIDALCKDGNLDAAINLMNEMKQKDIPPNIVTYNSIIDGMCKLGEWEKCKTLFSEMVNLNIYPNVRTFNILTDGLCKEGKVEDAKEVMGYMIEKGIEPDIITYNAIMYGYCLRGQPDGARRLFDFMINKCIKSNIISYNILINGYCKKKKLAKAMQLFCEISQKGPKPTTFIYNTILQGLFDVGRIGSAKNIYAEMLSAGCIPDLYTHGTLLNGYFKHGLVEEAISLFNKLEKQGENTDIEFYNVVINGLCKNGKLDKAHALFEKLSSMGLLPNVRTYTTMITGFYMLRKMEGNNCFPDNVTYNVMVQGFLRCSRISEMTTFMKEMTGRGFSFDASTIELLVNIIRENPSVLDMIPELHLKNNNLCFLRNQIMKWVLTSLGLTCNSCYENRVRSMGFRTELTTSQLGSLDIKFKPGTLWVFSVNIMIPSVLVVSLYDSVFVLSEMNTQTIARLKGYESPFSTDKKIIVRGRVDMIGLVSIGDIVWAVVSRHRDELSRLNAYIQGGY
ncbi:hypothetical protein R3W88_033177 [Solanum pinnatisectum]|uniref:Uncharacterized protein n=1 Tax=Solanum pinnatisectum TaxID=50273 RepID=A0AAV9K295_9SOLN|nr:hypothetical protein R3W88_033177 [Solanum pinnatisectum]